MKRGLSPGWWDRFWFADGSAYDLAGTRIVVSLQALWVLLSRDLAAHAALPADVWAGVPASLLWRYAIVPGHPALEYGLQLLAVLALVAAALGVRPRVSCLVAALLLYHLAPLEAIAWMSDPGERGFEVAILALVVLAFSPCADVWSVRRNRRPSATAPWEYRWPLMLVQSFLAWVYLLGGYGKLRHAGLAWISADNIRELIWFMNQWPGIGPFERFGPFLASLPAVPLVIAVATVLLEFSFPLALFSRTARRVIIPAAVVFHLGIIPAMNLAFPYTPLLLVFMNWEWLRARLTGSTYPAIAMDATPAS